MASNLDDEGRAELLCYLAVAQLIARAKTNEWLRTDHLVESERIWLSANGGSLEWFESVRLCRMSVELATSVWAIELLHDANELAMLLTDGWRLDYRSPIVRGLHDICAARLATWRYET
ncbi:hypothetical protein [Paraburkholderia terrae]